MNVSERIRLDAYLAASSDLMELERRQRHIERGERPAWDGRART
ncbi:DUF3563 family protein [Burkholderia ambifaria]